MDQSQEWSFQVEAKNENELPSVPEERSYLAI